MGRRVWDQVVTLNVGFMERLRISGRKRVFTQPGANPVGHDGQKSARSTPKAAVEGLGR